MLNLTSNLSPKTPAIEYIGASKTYSVGKPQAFEALKPLNLTIDQGDFFGLLGHNGAGKTTAINLLCGVSTLSGGQIKILGHDLATTETLCKRLIGIVAQELIADSFFRLDVMLRLQSKLSGVTPDEDWIEFLLGKLALKDHIKKTTRELSGGMKRRMMIARALVHKPRIIVLDEPTAGVDVELRHSMWEFISDLHKLGLTIILTTHYLEEAEQFCNRLAILKKGELVTLKTNRELLELGSRPRIIQLFSPTGVDLLEAWYTSHATLWQKELQAEGIIFKLGEDPQLVGDNRGMSLSCEYDEKSPASLQEAITKLSGFAARHGIVATHVNTARPSLEEVFLKLAF